MGGILGDNLGEGNCESKIASRQWGDNFCRETSICLAGPSGLVFFFLGGGAETKENAQNTKNFLLFPNLDGLAIRNANRGDSRESIRRKPRIFIMIERFARIASNLRFAVFSPSKRDSQNAVRVQFGNPETIRENQAIRANRANRAI